MSSNDQHHLNWINSTVLIIIETIFSFFISNDSLAKMYTRHFIDQNTLICLRVFFPSLVIYIQFNEHGALLELEEPADIESNPATVDIQATLLDLVKLFFISDANSLDQITLKGPQQDVSDFSALLLQFNFRNLMASVLQQLNVLNKKTTPDRTISEYTQRLAQQQTEINQLSSSITAKELKITQLQHSRKKLHLGYGLTIFFLIVVVLLLIW